MRSKTAKCIILGHKNFAEADKIIYLYSEEYGKIRAIAKGARRITSKFVGYLETLNICEVSLYFGPKNVIITEISSITNLTRIHKSMDSIYSALQVAEITNQMLYENQNLENLIKLIEKTVLHLNESEKPFLITAAYIIKLLDRIGLMPDYKAIDTNLEKKYQALLQYLKNKPLSKIEKIHLKPKEKNFLKNLVQTIIEEETNTSLNFF